MVLYNQSGNAASGNQRLLFAERGNVFVTTPGSGSDNYRLNLQVSGYSYSIFSLNIAGVMSALHHGVSTVGPFQLAPRP
jgi:hypothetical protein